MKSGKVYLYPPHEETLVFNGGEIVIDEASRIVTFMSDKNTRVVSSLPFTVVYDVESSR